MVNHQYTGTLYLNGISDTLIYQSMIMATSRGHALQRFNDRLRKSGINLLINKKDRIEILPFTPNQKLITIQEATNEQRNKTWR